MKKALVILLCVLCLGGCSLTGIDKILIDLEENEGKGNFVTYKGETYYFTIFRITKKDFGKMIAGETVDLFNKWRIQDDEETRP